MGFKSLTAALSAAPQITASEMQAIKDAVFRMIISNRPDGEGADQPTCAEVKAPARTLGIEAAHQPIVSGRVTDADADAFGALLESLTGPVLADADQATLRHKTYENIWSLGDAMNALNAKTAAAARIQPLLALIYWQAMLKGPE